MNLVQFRNGFETQKEDISHWNQSALIELKHKRRKGYY